MDIEHSEPRLSSRTTYEEALHRHKLVDMAVGWYEPYTGKYDITSPEYAYNDDRILYMYMGEGAEVRVHYVITESFRRK
jgi:hypothetical protein